MPAVAIPAIITAVASYASAATVFSLSVLTSALVVGGASLALGALSYALTPKPKGVSNDTSNQSGTVAVRQSDLTRAYVYGHARVIKGYAHIESTNSNTDLHSIIILCDGPLRAINEIWVDDYCIPNDALDSNGNVISGRYKGFMQIRKYLGTSTQLADTVAIANIPEWTVNHRLQGVAYMYVKMIKNQDIFPSGAPNLTAIVEGPALYDPRAGMNVWSTNIAQYCRDFIIDGKGFQANPITDVDDTNIAAEMNICDEIVTVLNELYPVAVGGVNATTNIIDLTSTTLTVNPLQYGDQVWVSSTGTIPGGLAASTNYYVIPYQILTNPRIMLATSLANAMAGTAIDITSVGTGTITITRNGEPRYHGSGVADSSTQLSTTLNDLVEAMAGRAVCVGGAWTLLAGAWRTPVITFTTKDIRPDGISWKNSLSMSDSYNIVSGEFRGPSTLYQDTDYPSAQYPEFIDDDLGIEAIKSINLPFTGRPTTAQRIAKIELFRGRQDIAVTCTMGTKALQVQPGDTVMMTIDRYGWAAKIFEVTTFETDISENGLLCKLGLRETASTIYDWSMGEAITFDPAPNTTLTDPFTVPVPSGVQYNSRAVNTQGADQLYVLQLEWLPSPDGFVQEFGDYEVQYKLSAGTTDDDYLPGGPPIPGALIAADVVTASANVHYDLRVRARNSLGVRSNWVTILNAIVGSTGGVVTNEDWMLVTQTPATTFLDYGLVTDAVTVTVDRGSV